MKFTPRTESEVTEKGLLPKGEYAFEAIAAENAKSKKGNEMIKVKLAIFPNDPSAKPRFLYEYLMEAMEFKLRHFCSATGLLPKYEAGCLDASDCEGKKGYCKIAIETDSSGFYPPKNVIKDFLATKSDNTSAQTPVENLEDKDDINF